MKYEIISTLFDKMEKTSKRLELIDLLVELFKNTSDNFIQKLVYLIQGELGPKFEGLEIGIADKLVVKAINRVSGISHKDIIDIYKKLGDIGKTAEQCFSNRSQNILFSKTLLAEDLFNALKKMSEISGSGATESKLKILEGLLSISSPIETKYITKIITGQLRLGIADYTIMDSLSIAYTNNKSNREYLEKAYNLSSDLGEVAKKLVFEGIESVKNVKIELNRPIRPMLAERLRDSKEIVSRFKEEFAIEWKIDGERLQIHKNQTMISIFSRRLENITEHYPDVIEYIKKYVKIDKCILEAEVVAVNPKNNRILPFQELMHRRRKHKIQEAVQKYPVCLYFFDLLYLGTKEFITKKYIDRRKSLEDIIKDNNNMRIVDSIITNKQRDIDKEMKRAISNHHEGLMIKNINSTYRSGAREFSWIKLKNEYNSEYKETIDLAIIGALYGKGRRTGKYGTYLLAAYDNNENNFYSICKVGSGFTDNDLNEIADLVNKYIVINKPKNVKTKIITDVWFTPKIVLEIIGSEITLSPIHTVGINYFRKDVGLAVRFPKFNKKIRLDKTAEDSTTVDDIIGIFNNQNN